MGHADFVAEALLWRLLLGHRFEFNPFQPSNSRSARREPEHSRFQNLILPQGFLNNSVALRSCFGLCVVAYVILPQGFLNNSVALRTCFGLCVVAYVSPS